MSSTSRDPIHVYVCQLNQFAATVAHKRQVHTWPQKRLQPLCTWIIELITYSAFLIGWNRFSFSQMIRQHEDEVELATSDCSQKKLFKCLLKIRRERDVQTSTIIPWPLHKILYKRSTRSGIHVHCIIKIWDQPGCPTTQGAKATIRNKYINNYNK